MRLLPRSLTGRLLVTALVALLAALAFAAFSISEVLERFVRRGLDERLDAQIEVVARAVRPDGSLDPRLAVDVPPFDRPGSGWVWQVAAPGGVLRSASLAQRRLVVESVRSYRPGRRDHDRRSGAESAILFGSGRQHGRTLIVPTARGEARVIDES